MDVRALVRIFAASALMASCVVPCAGCKWVKFVWEDEEPPPRPYDPFRPDYAQMWEDGHGRDNPNGPKIRSGEKKPGETPKKGNPFYETEKEERRKYREEQAAKPELIVVEPEVSFD